MKKEYKKLKIEHQQNGDAGNIVVTIFRANEVIFICDDGLVNFTSQDRRLVIVSTHHFM